MDNDGGLRAWARKYPSPNSLAGVQKKLRDGTLFNPSAYRKEQEAGTDGAMQGSTRALQYLERLWQGKTGRTEKKRRTTLKSYMLQEAEAASREAKLRWCKEEKVRAISLQHDGVVAMVRGAVQQGLAAQGMAQVATAACGYRVQIIPKQAAIIG